MRQMATEKTFQTGKVILLSLAHMLHDTYSCFLAPILPLLIEKLALTFTGAGLLSVIGRLTSLLNPLVGVIADKIKKRYLIIFAPVLTAVSMSLLGIAPSFSTLALLLMGMGLGSTCFHVPAPVMVRHVSGDRIGKGMSFYMFGGELARGLGPLVILAAVSFWGLEGTWRLMFFAIGMSAILFFKLHSTDISHDFPKEKIQTGLIKTFFANSSLFIFVSGFIFFRGLMRSAMTVFLPTYLKLNGSSLWLAGISLAIVQFSGAGITFFSGSLSDRIGRRKTLLFSSLAAPLAMFVFLFSKGPFRLGALILFGLAFFAQGPVMLALVHDTKHERPAFINSLYMTINFLLVALTSLLTGFLGDKIGLNLTFFLAPLAALAAIPFVLKLSGTKKDHSSSGRSRI